MEIKNKIHKFENFILYVNTCNECYFKMTYGDKDWEKVYDIAPAFFGTARKSIQSEIFMTLGKIYESSKRSDQNLNKLLNYIDSNSSKISSDNYLKINEYVKNSRVKLDNNIEVINRVLSIRDKAYAHNDNDYFYSENTHNQIGINYEEVKSLIILAGEIINDFNRILYNSATHMRYSNIDDVENLMKFCLRNL